MKLPKPATTVMLESIVEAQTVTLVPMVQLDTKTMLQKVDRVCPVFPVNFKMKMARRRATIAQWGLLEKETMRPNANDATQV
jgi:hypothetical protein